ncbi:DUF4382 domain-containing protein [candidate division WOR-3 bacterium]|nr:DUF4382 domain-containing protein [candidate division WOR-3 bacterium]
MKREILFFIFILLFLMGCGQEKGKIRIWLIDAPPPQVVEHIYLTVVGVGIRNSEGDAITLQLDPYTVDIVGLMGGFAAPLTFNYSTGSYFVDVEPGDYTGVLLLLAEINSLVMEGDSVADSLLIPEGVPIEYELDEAFTVLPGEYRTIIVDFDASKSINWYSEPYELIPSFRIFQSSTAGFIRGIVKTIEDTSEVAVKFATLHAVSSTDTMTTLSDSTGKYSLFIPEGTYDVSVSAEGYTVFDTLYEGVVVNSDSVLDNYNFILE